MSIRLSKQSAIIVFFSLLLITYGIITMVGWLFKLPLINDLREVHFLTSFNSALCFILSSLGLLLTFSSTRLGRWLQFGIGLFLCIFAGIVLIENILDFDLGFGQLFAPVWIDNPGPSPGRMAPKVSLAFSLFGINLMLWASNRVNVFNYATTLFIFFIGLIGVAGYILKIDTAFIWYNFTRITLGGSIGFLILSICFFIAINKKKPINETSSNPAKKIGILSGIILTIVALVAGLAGFAIVMQQYEKYLKETLQNSLNEKAAIIEGEIEGVATEIESLIHSAIFRESITNQQGGSLKTLADFFIAQGFSAIKITDKHNNILIDEGKFIEKPQETVSIESPKSLLLIENKKFFIRVSQPIIIDSQYLGDMSIEWPLPKISYLFSLARSNNIEFLVCSHSNPERVYCLSSQTLSGFEAPLSVRNSKAPIARDIADKVQSTIIFDNGKRHIFVSYSALDRLGLSLVHKTNMMQVLSPVFKPLKIIGPIIILSIIIGILMLYWRVIPLVHRLVDSEKKANLQQQQLQESEAYTRAVIENIGEGIISIDSNGFIESCTATVSEIFGYSVDEIIHKNIITLMPPAYRDKNLKKLRPYLKKDRNHYASKGTIELEGLHKDGTIFPLELSIRETFIQGRRVFTGILHDLSYRKKAEAKFKSLLDGAPDALVILNDQADIIMANTRIEKLFGYDKKELIGQKVEILMPERFRHNNLYYQGYFLNPQLQMENSGLGLYALHKDGHEFPVEVSLSPIESGGEVLVLGAVRDISERKRIERLKNEFISIVSHELRTPLTSIHGAIALLVGSVAGELPEKANQLLIIAKKNSERLIRLINDMLDIEKIEAGKMKLYLDIADINDLVKEAIIANQVYSDKFSVITHIGHTLPPTKVRVDRDRLLQVLANLISNAVKFSPPKGEVTIDIFEQPGNRVRVAITDKGMGIPEEFKQAIFQKFVQADTSMTRKNEGTGLGLSISKAIIEKLGGTIGFVSEINKGTTFYFDLPIWDEEKQNKSDA